MNAASALLSDVNTLSLMNSLSLEVSEGVVTDKVIIQKAVFYQDSEGHVSCIIDIRPQPSYSTYFLGQGRFDLSDRELRAMLEQLIAQLNNFAKDIIEIDGVVKITQNNYPVAEYKNGKVMLSGE